MSLISINDFKFANKRKFTIEVLEEESVGMFDWVYTNWADWTLNTDSVCVNGFDYDLYITNNFQPDTPDEYDDIYSDNKEFFQDIRIWLLTYYSNNFDLLWSVCNCISHFGPRVIEIRQSAARKNFVTFQLKNKYVDRCLRLDEQLEELLCTSDELTTRCLPTDWIKVIMTYI